MRVKLQGWFTVFVGLTVAAAVGVLLFSLNGFTLWGKSRQVWDARVVIDQILPAAKLITVEATSTQQLTITDDWFEQRVLPKLIGREIQAAQTATLQIGFDLHGWDAAGSVSLEPLTRTAVIQMPDPVLIGVVLDPHSKQLFVKAGLFRNWDLTPAETVQIEQALDEKFRQASEVPDLTHRARTELQNRLEELFRPHGYTVQIAYAPNPRTAEATWK